MEDRELLELAAKCMDGEYRKHALGNNYLAFPPNWNGIFWNPLEDTGQAITLALKLGICIQPIPECDTVNVYQEREFTAEPYNCHTVACGDVELRRAIVRAAAEIGKAMP